MKVSFFRKVLFTAIAMGVTVSVQANLNTVSTCGTESEIHSSYENAENQKGFEIVKGEWHIYNAQGLKLWASRVNRGGKNLNAVLMNDIDMGGAEWLPLGDSKKNAYIGIFDGNGKTISNFRIGSPENYTDKVNVGFFGYVYRGAIIKNLTLSDVALFVKSGTETAVGILCGRAESAHILNCDVKKSTIKEDGRSALGESSIGGLTGIADSFTNIIGSKISSVSVKTSNVKGAKIGGLLGMFDQFLTTIACFICDQT